MPDCSELRSTAFLVKLQVFSKHYSSSPTHVNPVQDSQAQRVLLPQRACTAPDTLLVRFSESDAHREQTPHALTVQRLSRVTEKCVGLHRTVLADAHSRHLVHLLNNPRRAWRLLGTVSRVG